MTDARSFYSDFVSSVTMDYWEEYHDNTRWTGLVTKLLRKQIESYELTSQTEYFRIDVTGWKSHWKDIEGRACEVGLKPHLWDLKIAVEHENNSSDWSDELIKLAHIRCPLKVIIGYTPCDLRAEGKEGRRLEFAADSLKMVEAFASASREEPKEEFLLILGNSSPHSSSNAAYSDYGYRGYLFDYSVGSFKSID